MGLGYLPGHTGTLPGTHGRVRGGGRCASPAEKAGRPDGDFLAERDAEWVVSSSVRSEGSRAEYLYLLFDDEDHIPLDTHVFNTEVSRNLSSAGEPDPRRPVGGVRVRWATLAQWDDSWWSAADAALAPVPIDLLLGKHLAWDRSWGNDQGWSGRRPPRSNLVAKRDWADAQAHIFPVFKPAFISTFAAS